MDLYLSNKVAIVTGASRGIGKAIAETLSAEGMKLVLAARSKAELESLAKSLPNESLVQVIDLREPDSASKVITSTIEKFGKLDLLVNNAGATKRGDFLTLADDEWMDGFALKFYAAMRLSRAAWAYLKESNGTIINIIAMGQGEPALWVGLSALFPLVLLLLSGLYLFVLPYAARWRSS